ncbi:MAG TPA: hypothetical protein VFH56_04880, partial [Acidimicrobiales bacterium]|nr:hypothetical protein [Acidimicrobiales bacterium]
MALHSQRRNRDVRRSSGGFLAVWGRVLASLGMVMSALVGITVATQSAASALTFGPDNFMDISGSIRYDGIGTAGWANGPEAAADLLPTGTSGADLTTCSTPVGGIHAPGTNGIFDCGTSTQNPTFTSPGNGVFSHSFTSGFSSACGGNYGFHTNAQITDDLTADQYGPTPGTPKDSIANTYAIARHGSQGNEVYVGLERPNPGGDTHVDFEFLQENVGLDPSNLCGGTGQSSANFVSSSPSNGAREQGDVMLEMNYLQGGFSPTPTVYIWSCTGSLTAPPALPANGTPCSFKDTSHGGTGATWVVDTALAAGAAVIATDTTTTPGYNATTQTVSCGGWFCDPPSGSKSVPQFGFTEGAINLDQLGLGIGCESTMMAVTRSAAAGQTSALQYFSPPSILDTCTPTTTVTTPTNSSGHAVGTGTSGIPLGGSVHDVAVVSPTTASTTAPTGTVNFFLCGPSATALASCATTDPTRQSIGTANPTAGTANSPVTGETTWSSVDFSPTTMSQIGNYCFEGDYVPTGKFEPSSDNGTAQASLECFSVFGVADLVTSKVSSPVSTHSVDPGDSVTYTLTFDNSKGTAAAPVNFTDDLT